MGQPWQPGDLDTALFLAAHFKKGPAIIRLLCSAGAHIDARWQNVRDWLHSAASLPDTLDESASLILQMKHPGATPLIRAALLPDGRVDPWIACGAASPATDARGRTALHYCAEQSNWRAVRALLAVRSPGWDAADQDGNRPVDIAMTSRDGRVLDALLEAGSAPLHPLRDPAAFEPGAALRLALSTGVEPPQTAQGAQNMLRLLPAEERYRRPEERLFRAVENHYPDLVQLLLTAGVEPRFHGPGRQSCLHAAAKNGDVQSLRLLLATTASPVVNAPNDEGDTPLHLACREGGANLAAIEALLAAGAQAGALDRQERNCLHLLAAVEDTAAANAVPALLQAGAVLEAPGPDGNTPLVCAIRSARPALTQALLDAAANPDALVDGLCNALGACASAADVRLLIKAGAKLSCSDPGVSEALLRQASYGSLETFDALLRAVDRPCSATSRQGGETLLHRVAWADESPSATRVEWVLALCHAVDPRDSEGKTPLMAAARYGTPEAVHRLLEAGANPASEDNAGMTAAAHARAKSQWDLADRLEARQA